MDTNSKTKYEIVEFQNLNPAITKDFMSKFLDSSKILITPSFNL